MGVGMCLVLWPLLSVLPVAVPLSVLEKLGVGTPVEAGWVLDRHRSLWEGQGMGDGSLCSGLGDLCEVSLDTIAGVSRREGDWD